MPLLKELLANIRGRIEGLDYEGKRRVLDSLDITVWINGKLVAITGVVNPEVAIVTNASLLNTISSITREGT